MSLLQLMFNYSTYPTHTVVNNFLMMLINCYISCYYYYHCITLVVVEINDVYKCGFQMRMRVRILLRKSQCQNVNNLYVSRPLLKIATWRYQFRLSRYVYDGNRSFAPIHTKTKTVESDVLCLLTRLDDGEQSTGSKYLNTVQDQNSSFSLKQRMTE